MSSRTSRKSTGKSSNTAPEQQKREYFVPAYGVTVEAVSAEKAVEQAKKIKEKTEDADV